VHNLIESERKRRREETDERKRKEKHGANWVSVMREVEAPWEPFPLHPPWPG
jgi:hypothetical protein